MRNKAINALLEMGMPANLKGFDYIVDAMCLFEQDDEWRTGKTTTLYWKIGQMRKTTPARVERAMRHAFQTVLTTGNISAVNKYLTFQNMTNSNLLAVLYIRLSQEGENHAD